MKPPRLKGKTHFNKKGEFQSDKYSWCPPGFVPLKLSDPMAWIPLIAYATERRKIDEQFAVDLFRAVKREEKKSQPKPTDS